MKRLILILVVLWFWLLAPITVHADSASDLGDRQASQEAVQPLKTYYLSVLEGGGRREIKIDPPATKIAVTSQSGDTTIRCGDANNSYSCSPGKRIELKYEATTPVVKFWAENSNHTQVRLQIDVYQTVAEGNE